MLRNCECIIIIGMESSPTSRRTPQRGAIEAALQDAGRPLGPCEILNAARPAAVSLSLATVYRCVRRMLTEHLIVAVHLPGQPPRYELRAAAALHHHHFHCDACNCVFDLEGCPNDLQDLLPRGFRHRAHEIVLYGTCVSCAKSG